MNVATQQLIAGLFEPALRNLAYFERRLKAFGIVAIVAFPLFYFVWHDIFPQPHESLGLRLFGSALFVPLLFAERWPERARRYLPHYWYFSLLYALPFFFTFMMLKNDANEVWLQSALVAIFVMILLLDWMTLVAHFILGTGLAVAAYLASTDTPVLAAIHFEHLAIVLFALVIGTVSNYDSERVRIEQERAMLATAGSIAHELRTPLLGIRTGASGLTRYLPTLIEAYRLAREHQLPVRQIRAAHLDAMKGVLERIDTEAAHSNAIIDMLLVTARMAGAAAHETTLCSMARVVTSALRRYPFADHECRLVRWDGSGDFNFRGNELLAVHVLFNLIKNALRHIAAAGKGEIVIRLETGPRANRLVFRDSGAGIDARTLPHIFQRFYTSAPGDDSELGSGIGLAFCRDVMRACGGKIECDAVPGEYTEFVLTFPPP